MAGAGCRLGYEPYDARPAVSGLQIGLPNRFMDLRVSVLPTGADRAHFGLVGAAAERNTLLLAN